MVSSNETVRWDVLAFCFQKRRRFIIWFKEEEKSNVYARYINRESRGVDFEKVDDNKYHISGDLKELYPHYLRHLESYIPDTIIFELDTIRLDNDEGLIEEESEIIVSPNPSDGPIKIQNIPLDITTLKVFDLTGKLIDQREIANASMNINANVSKSLYILEFSNEEKVYTNKVLVQ